MLILASNKRSILNLSCITTENVSKLVFEICTATKKVPKNVFPRYNSYVNFDPKHSIVLNVQCQTIGRKAFTSE